MKMEKKTLAYRLSLIALCFVVAVICLKRMNETYDPLARYPYADASNREKILNNLNEKEIDYMITQQLRPEEYMEFIGLPDFSIYNTLYYTQAKNTQNTSDEYIVNFVNKYRPRFSLDSLKMYLINYSYADLTSFFENEQVMHQNMQLVQDPRYMYLVLNQNRSVYHYVPDDLYSQNGVLVKKEVAASLKNMFDDFNKTFEGQWLSVEEGYLNYEQVVTKYLQAQEVFGDDVDEYMLPGGSNEQQLGYTVAFEGHSKWNEAVAKEKCYIDHYYGIVEEELDENEREKIEWIRNNAWRYGFTVRYPQGKEAVTAHYYQPYLVRYVGREQAKRMYENNLTMEEMDFGKEQSNG